MRMSTTTSFSSVFCLSLSLIPCITASVPRHDFTPVDFASACYAEPLPASASLPPSTDNRTVPWGTQGIVYANGTTCCASLDDVRAGIDAVDAQILALLSQRAAYVREATRFKATRDTVDVPARDQQVIDGAVANAPGVQLPATIARAVFSAIISANVPFEQCVFDSFVDPDSSSGSSS